MIKANHVSFEPPERKEPFFGSEKPDLWKGTEQKKREELETEHENEGYDKEEFDGERRRPPFFWDLKLSIKTQCIWRFKNPNDLFRSNSFGFDFFTNSYLSILFLKKYQVK